MGTFMEDNVLPLIAEMDEAIDKDSDCYLSMYFFFAGKEKYYKDHGETDLANVALTLAWVTHMAIDAESTNAPIIAAVTLHDKCSVSPENLNSEQRDFLERLYPQLSAGLLKSRIAEIVLMLNTPRRWDLVDEIIEGYLTEPLSDEAWYSRQQTLWTRAVKLSRQFKKEDLLSRIEAQIQQYLDTHSPENPGISLTLYRFIIKQYLLRFNLEINGSNLKTFATHEKSVKNFSIAERIFWLVAEFYKHIPNQKEQMGAVYESAECLFLEAENRAKLPYQGNLVASGLYEQALQRYRLLPAAFRDPIGANHRIEECLKRIREHGKLSLQDMHTFTLPSTDLTEIAETSINHVRGKKDIFDAILHFVSFDTITAKIVQENETHPEFSFSDLFGAVFLSGDGRAVGRTSASGSDQSLVRQMQYFDSLLQFVVAGEIMPAMNQLMQEFNFSLNFIEELCHFSTLIPNDRVKITARGLYLGFEYRFSESIHLLSPQVEFMVRNILKQANIITSTIDRAGIESEVGLSALLDKPEAQNILGADLHFNIASLFTNPLGANIRNYVAHGLLNDYSSESDAVVYAWWLYLKVIIMSATQTPLFKIPHPE